MQGLVVLCSILAVSQVAMGFAIRKPSSFISTKLRYSTTQEAVQVGTFYPMSDKKNGGEEKYGMERFQEMLEKGKKDPRNKKPPIYEPGPFPEKLIAAAAYLIPIVDVADLGKYLFQAYPEVGELYNSVFGGVAAVYSGVPFLPFAVFFVMSYIARAPTFPVEIRFHFAQAFMISLIQVIPSLTFGILEKAGVPGMAVLYNTVFFWVVLSSVFMQFLILSPLAKTKNPFVVNVVGIALRFMNYSPSMSPRNR